MKEKFEPTNINEKNKKDESLIEVVSPVGAEGRKISEEVLKETGSVEDKSDGAKKESGEKENDETTKTCKIHERILKIKNPIYRTLFINEYKKLNLDKGISLKDGEQIKDTFTLLKKIQEMEKVEKNTESLDKKEKDKNESDRFKKQNHEKFISPEEIALLNAEKMTGQETKETKENAETEKEGNKEADAEKEKTSEELLDEAREHYTNHYQDFLKKSRLARVKNFLGIEASHDKKPGELLEAEILYSDAKSNYAREEFEKIKADIEKDEKLGDKYELIENCRNEILNDVVLGEMEKIKEIEKNSQSSEKQNTLTKAYKEWTGFSKKKRIAYSVLMMTGVAGFASLTAPVSASVAALGMVGVAGNKLIRMGVGMASSALAGKGFDWLTKSTKENIKRTKEENIEMLQMKFSGNNFTEIEKRYKEILNQEKRREGLLLVGKAVTMGAAGYYGATTGLGMVDDVMTGGGPDVIPKPGVILESDPNYDVAPLMEPVADEIPTEIKGVVSGESGENVLSKSESSDTLPNAEEAVKEIISKTPEVSEVLSSHSIKSGDNLWSVLKNKIPEIDELERAGMKDNAVANLIEKIKDNPQEYGISSGDVDNLKIGDEINLGKIQTLLETEKIGTEGLLEHAQGLNEETLDKIENHKPEPEATILPETESHLPTDSVATPETQEPRIDAQTSSMEEIYEQAIKEGEQNLGLKLEQFGEQFVKEEWNVLKEMPVAKALEGIEDFKEKGFFSRLFSSDKSDSFGAWLSETTEKNYIGNQSDMVEMGNRQQLRAYLKQAFEATGKPFPNESLGEYLKQYETNSLASAMRAKNPSIGV